MALHIISAGVWISQFVAEFALDRLAQSMKGKAGQAIAVLGTARAASLMGTVGGTGILITGLLLTFEFRYGILGIGGVYTPTWLVIKQIIFIIAMALVGSMVTRTTRQALPQVMQAINAGTPLPAEAEAALNRATMVSRIVNLLVLINIFIGVYAVNGGYLV
ncbi:MAG TPA: hypothetical protein VHD90_08125 [Phototrophicaceae bacterium]|nr:hypothetical protein [Phototrophicaceae bacterium]